MGAGRACSDAVHRDAIKAGLERHALRVLSNTRQRPGQWDPFGRLDRSPDPGPSSTRSPGSRSPGTGRLGPGPSAVTNSGSVDMGTRGGRGASRAPLGLHDCRMPRETCAKRDDFRLAVVMNAAALFIGLVLATNSVQNSPNKKSLRTIAIRMA